MPRHQANRVTLSLATSPSKVPLPFAPQGPMAQPSNKAFVSDRLRESEGVAVKATGGEAIVHYCEPPATQAAASSIFLSCHPQESECSLFNTTE
jgi:hypothetical protein